jgi:hypothetical protein
MIVIDITRKRGDTKADVFSLTNPETWEPANLTGCSLRLVVDSRREPDDETTQEYEIVGVVEDPLSGKVSFAPTLEQADLVGTYFYEVELTDAFGGVLTPVGGKYVYQQDIAK